MLERYWSYLGLAVVVAALVSTIVILYNVATADGKVDHCYIRSSHSGAKVLVGYRPWRANTYIATSDTPDRLIEIGKELGCIK